jgi:hypothetical protein
VINDLIKSSKIIKLTRLKLEQMVFVESQSKTNFQNIFHILQVIQGLLEFERMGGSIQMLQNALYQVIKPWNFQKNISTQAFGGS